MMAKSARVKATKRRAAGEPVRAKGKQTRRRILEEAAVLFGKHQLSDVSVSTIARAAGVYPNQVTYYFGSKDALLIHSAFFALLHDAERLEAAGYRMQTVEGFKSVMARTILALPSMRLVAQAVATGNANPGLAGTLGYYLHLLFRQSERYLQTLIGERNWSHKRPLTVEVRTFWSTAFGAVLLSRAGVRGSALDLDLAGTLTIYEKSE
ncbi:TetR/AcrR family transcriptional regulator C-terminal domain-containing protein [Citricoccus nitrophenolicus]|uniref:TetR/AcrR family transcriptional regulator C-terminal domain-containing protein n=1 Tax=Citricoccus nitrophenolicus TaxID=863575 RepID=UPI0031E9FC76